MRTLELVDADEECWTTYHPVVEVRYPEVFSATEWSHSDYTELCDTAFYQCDGCDARWDDMADLARELQGNEILEQIDLIVRSYQ